MKENKTTNADPPEDETLEDEVLEDMPGGLGDFDAMTVDFRTGCKLDTGHRFIFKGKLRS